MSFQTLRLLVILGLASHFLVRLRLVYGAGHWFAPVALALLVLVLPQSWPGQVQSWPEPAAECFLTVGPLALGYLLFFLLAALSLDLVRLALAWSASLGAPAARLNFLTAEKSAALALALAAAITLNSYHMAHHPRLLKVELQTARLPAGELRIVQISDVHLSRFIRSGELKRMMALVHDAAPDLVVFTGDLLDSPAGAAYEEEAALLAGLKPRLGVFAVLGNHERYFGLPEALDFYRRAGIKLLRGRAEELPGLVVAGVDDEVFGGEKDAGRLLEAFRNDRRFILFLKHRPAPAPGAAGLFDLQLSGHTHGGQIWPNHFLVARANGQLHGLHPAPGRGWAYTSRGAGFWGLPLRFLAPPEITLFILRRPAGADI